jgi:hypothetical protein
MATTIHLENAKDLTREPPRSPRVLLGNYVLMARMIDKCRATINGTAGEYHFDCPVDIMLFSFKELKGDEVRQIIATGASDEDILAWCESHGRPKTAAEVRSWAARVQESSPYDDPRKRDWFAGECRRLGLEPGRTTLFEYLEADDEASFSR